MAKYKRVLIKISGEALGGGDGIFDFAVIDRVCDVIARCVRQGVQIAIVVGGGNIFRGARDGAEKLNRARADHIGMLGTAINALALCDALERHGVPARVQTAIEMRTIAEPFIRLKALRHLEKGRVVVFACGTGSPFFSTDTAAVLRGAEIGAEVIMLAKNVDGVYSDDPRKNPQAVKFDAISYDDVLRGHLSALDFTATSLSMENRIPVLLFALSDPENILRAVQGENVGTIVREENPQ
jgi:uridylate kinase